MKHTDNLDKFTELADKMESDPDLFGSDTRAELRETIVANLRRGWYGDFTSPFPAPKMKMVDDFRDLGRNDIANQVIAGDFDQ